MKTKLKQLLLAATLLAAATTATAQAGTENYIRTREMTSTAGNSYVDHVQYYDGLGRPYQQLVKSVATGSARQRIITLQEYDAAGRPLNSWLPTAATADHLSPAVLKANAQGSTYGYNDTRPYSHTQYEASPLGRAERQYGEGAAWYTNGRAVKSEHLANVATAGSELACKYYYISNGALAGGTTLYATASLHVEKTTDENNNAGYRFVDKEGRTLLVRQMNGTEQVDTYYVYDDFNCLRVVLQPMYQVSGNIDRHAFRYDYDSQLRCIKKTLPGAQHILYSYNTAGLPAYRQDGVQRASGKWTYYKYDVHGRILEQGECLNQNNTSSPTVHLKYHYDTYGFIGSGGFANSSYTAGNSYGRGYLTGMEVTALGGAGTIYRAFYYDIKGREVKRVENNLLGGMEVTSTTYSFTGKPLAVTHTHSASGKAARTEVTTYGYDHMERIATVTHKVGSAAAVTLASYTYDNKGRMTAKALHGSSTNRMAYSYNIRNWLTGISSGKFTQALGYGSHYNGSISTMSWTANGASHSYTFAYDALDRMLSATHGSGLFTEKVGSYDKNGNILSLQRYGNGLIDNLTYTYSGNQVTKVEDATGNTAGFSNGASTANEYVYDANGNLTKDSNKNISSITYNSLNLPSKVTFSDGSTISYTYAADGTKLRTVHTIGGVTTQNDYCANVIYENGVQKYLLNEEGYVDLSASTPTYYYYLKDHQGNNRVVINSSGTVVETNHYYPFGGVFASTGNVQPYKYNGKEPDTKKGLNWYDYGARHYDPVLGRWMVQDPLAEKYYDLSPYIYCNNSPIRYIDPTGKAWKPIYNEDDKGNRIYKGYEWIPESDSYNQDGTLKAGLYAQAIFFSDNGTFDVSKRYNMGSSTAYVYLADGTIQTFDANTHPSSEDYAMIPEGIYNAKVGKHKSSYTALRMSDINHESRIELGIVNPKYEDGRTFAEGINIHKPGLNNLTGMTNSGTPVSEGCLLIDRNNWNEFIRIFDITEQRFNKISVIVSRSLNTPFNYKK